MPTPTEWFTRRQMRPRECGSGKTPGALDNCTTMVAAGDGVRAAGTVYCSDEHAPLDQSEALF
jgi:hypothetical protein